MKCLSFIDDEDYEKNYMYIDAAFILDFLIDIGDIIH